MTFTEFRRMALALKDAIEGAHMGHPDFRVNGRIFATLHADMTHGMVKLTPEQQAEFMQASPAFGPENGAWGRQGCTRVLLSAVDEETLGAALTLARQNLVESQTVGKRSTAGRAANKSSRRRRTPR